MTKVLFVDPILIVFFLYGLAFYTMGLAVAFETSAHIADRETRRALGMLAAFGILHGLHEWFEMFITFAQKDVPHSLNIEIVRLAVLTVSFGLLCLFGCAMLCMRTQRKRRWLVPITLFAAFGIGVGLIAFWLAPDWDAAIHATDAWARYTLGATGGVLAGTGLLVRAGDAQRHNVPAARGWFLAGISLAIYGLIGQTVPAPSALFPSTVYNTEVFRHLFGFPVQVLRSAAAATAMVGLIHALHEAELERQRTLRAAETRAQEEMARRQELQTELLRRTVAAQEEERARMARELHDHIGQMLTALSYRIEGVRAALASGQPMTAEMADALYQLADRAHADLRHLITDLRPAQLDDLGLVAALHWLADRARQQFDLDVEIEIKGHKSRLPAEMETVLFRVAQEALTNVARHAGVDTARMSLAFGPYSVTLEVADEGCGFNVTEILGEAVTERQAWGIIGMRERLLAAGGQLMLCSEPGKGTIVRAVIPLQAGAETHE